jgi:transcriptional regulator of arginine metabolism
MKKRQSRLPVIIEILNNNSIGSQEELSKQLAIRGFLVTQATLSRDLKALRTTKVATDMGGYRYIVPENHKALADAGFDSGIPSTMQSAKHPAALSITMSGNMVVIKTRLGYASGLAYDLDAMNSSYILGTIPGADTVFVVVAEGVTREELYETFIGFLPESVMEAAHSQFFMPDHSPETVLE